MRFTNNAGGTDLWKVDATGTLQAGTVAAARIGAPVRQQGNPVTSAAGAHTATGLSTTATCPSGVLLGGGATVIASDGSHSAALQETYPSSSSAWAATAVVTTNLGNGVTVTLNAWAICTQ